nr:serine/threonine protein kinase [Armatimonadota bacterium]
MPQEREYVARPEGTRLGRYRLGREIGRGFSSIVYEAVDTERGRTVALKALTFFGPLDPERREDLTERFAREARAISALAHPAIVAIYEFGQTGDGRWFTAMERLQGETLRSRLQREGALTPEEALPLVVQIAEALQYAHERGIVHRDVKPDNIFLLPDGRAKLMDFGVAHVLSDQALTQTGTIVGSPAYMSPEQINGQMLDGRSDVFSLGVTLAEMLAGVKPFDAPTIPAVMHRILHRRPQIAAVSPWAMRRVVAKALAKKRTARFSSAAALADALRRQSSRQWAETIWEPMATLIRHGAPLPLAYRSAPAPAPTRPALAQRSLPPLAWVAAALAVVAMSAWPLLAHRRRPVTPPTLAGAGHVHTISL